MARKSSPKQKLESHCKQLNNHPVVFNKKDLSMIKGQEQGIRLGRELAIRISAGDLSAWKAAKRNRFALDELFPLSRRKTKFNAVIGRSDGGPLMMLLKKRISGTDVDAILMKMAMEEASKSDYWCSSHARWGRKGPCDFYGTGKALHDACEYDDPQLLIETQKIFRGGEVYSLHGNGLSDSLVFHKAWKCMLHMQKQDSSWLFSINSPERGVSPLRMLALDRLVLADALYEGHFTWLLRESENFASKVSKEPPGDRKAFEALEKISFEVGTRQKSFALADSLLRYRGDQFGPHEFCARLSDCTKMLEDKALKAEGSERLLPGDTDSKASPKPR